MTKYMHPNGVTTQTIRLDEAAKPSRQRIDVHTRDLANLDEPPTHRRIDWTHEGRDWLMRHMTFAMRTGKSVTLAPVGE